MEHLTVVLGDATGHGMKAGTMVTTTKSLFNVLAPNPNIVETFHEMTRCLKLMQMDKLINVYDNVKDNWESSSNVCSWYAPSIYL